MSEFLDVRQDGRTTILTIQRQAKRNALHGPLWTAIEAAAKQIQKDPPRAVIITGAGEHFCAGMDLSMDNPLIERLVPSIQKKDEAALRTLIRELKQVFAEIESIPCPVIAAIEGACAGGGLELALSCDLRVASSEAFFSLPEARAGMVPDLGGTVKTREILGRARSAELTLTGEKITAEQAEQWGLINHLCDPGMALEAAMALAVQISVSSPAATREILGMLRRSPAREEELSRETEAGVRALLSGDCVEGVQAFMEKRKPNWAD